MSSIDKRTNTLPDGFIVQVAVASLLFLAPIATVLGFYYVVILPIESEPRLGTPVVQHIFEQIPRRREFYHFVAVFAGAYLGWRWWTYSRLRSKEPATNASSESDQVAVKLRLNAIALRTRADLLLGGAFFLLFAGVYFIIVVLPHMSGADKVRIAHSLFSAEFGSTIDCIVNGRCMFVLDDEVSSAQEYFGAPALDQIEIEVFDGVSVEMKNIDAVTDSLESSSRSGRSYKTVESLGSDEMIVTATYSDDGTIGILTGSSGSIFLTADRAETWRRLPLRDSDETAYATLSADGNAAIIWTRSGDAYVIAGDMREEQLSPLELEFTSGERIVGALLSADGSAAIVRTSRGRAYRTVGELDDWIPIPLGPSPAPITATALNADGSVAIIATRESQVYFTINGLGEWRPLTVQLAPGESIRFAALNADGTAGILGTSENQIYVTESGLTNLELVPSLEDKRRITALALSADGSAAMIVKRGPRIYVATDGLRNWQQVELELGLGLGISGAALNADGSAGAIRAGTSGASSVYVAAGDLKNWVKFGPEGPDHAVSASFSGSDLLVTRYIRMAHVAADNQMPASRLWLLPGETVAVKALNADSTAGILGGDRGTVFVKRSGQEDWQPMSLGGGIGGISVGSLNADGTFLLIGTYGGAAYVRKPDSDHWEFVEELGQPDSFRPITLTALTRDGRAGILGRGDREVHVTTGGLDNWTPVAIPLEFDERLAAAEFSVDGTSSLIAGNRGSIAVSNDGGNTWYPQKLSLDSEDSINKVTSSAALTDGLLLHSDEGSSFVLGRFPSLAGWVTMSLTEIAQAVESDILLKHSKIGQSVVTFVERTVGGVTAPGFLTSVSGSGQKTNSEEGPLAGVLNNLTLIRIVTLTVLFFLVQILVRLYQYSLRLAAFSESRADALLIAQKITGNKVRDLGGVVDALAPDAYDFKPGPKPQLDWWRSRRDQQ